MSAQPTTKGRNRGTSKTTQAVAGVAGALAFLGIGWAMGQRSASVQASLAPSAGATTAVPALPIRGEWGDEEGGQWGTLPGAVSPAQPGTGSLLPPTTGSGGSSVAGASTSTTTATTATGAVTAPTITTATAGGKP